MASCANLTGGIAASCESSLGGIKQVLIANYVDNAYTVNESEEITSVDSGATFHSFYIKKNTSNFTSTLNVDQTNGVNYVSTEISLVFNKMDTNKRLAIGALTLSDTLVIVEDSNGTYWAFGKDEPVTVSAGTGESGTAKTDGNKYSITLTDESLSWPMHLTEDAIKSIKIA